MWSCLSLACNEEFFGPLADACLLNGVMLGEQPVFSFFSEPEGLSYKYFKQELKGSAFTEELLVLRNCANRLTGDVFNVAFINLYQTGQQHIPAHRDKTHKDHSIVSFSFYKTEDTKPEDLRSLWIYEDSKTPVVLEMQHNSIIIMHPGMQETHTHWVPPSDTLVPRVNVTFRIQK